MLLARNFVVSCGRSPLSESFLHGCIDYHRTRGSVRIPSQILYTESLIAQTCRISTLYFSKSFNCLSSLIGHKYVQRTNSLRCPLLMPISLFLSSSTSTRRLATWNARRVADAEIASSLWTIQPDNPLISLVRAAENASLR